MTSRERVFGLLNCLDVDRLPLMPITMMWAADRLGARYLDYCVDHRVLVEAQIRVAEEFGFDYVNTMSDPAREAADCGAEVCYYDHQPVAINEEQALLRDKLRLVRMRMPDPLGGGRMHNGIKAVSSYRERLGREKVIEGWVEGPIAQAADLRGINALMLDFFDDPKFVTDLFDFVVALELRFARQQVDAGADIIGIGDAAASLVGPRIYEEFVWPYEEKLVSGIHGFGARTRLHICGDTRKMVQQMARLGCAIADIDSITPMREARAKMGKEQVLLGNLNPVTVMRNGTAAEVTVAVTECHREAGPRFIVGAGCEIPRGTPVENVRALCEYAHTHRP